MLLHALATTLVVLAASVSSADDLEQARRHLDAERYGKALDAAERVLGSRPDDADARAIESAALLGQKRPAQAAARAEAWATRAPGDPRPLVLLARALGAKEDWTTLRNVAVRVKDAPVEIRTPVFREVARQYCDGPGCEVAADVLADLVAVSGQGPEHLLDVALEIASRGERDRALAALERYLETTPVERDVVFALHAVGRALVRAATRSAPNPPAGGWAFVPIDDTVTKPVKIRDGELRGPPRPRRDSEGSATFEIAILRTGHPVPLRLLSEQDRGFATATFYALLRTRYAPATKGGVAVPVILTARMSWRTS